jgi:hypothetical protein
MDASHPRPDRLAQKKKTAEEIVKVVIKYISTKSAWKRGGVTSSRPPFFSADPNYFLQSRESAFPCVQTLLSLLFLYHWLNMELDLQSLFGLLCTAVLIGWGPATSPNSPAFGLIYEGAIGQPRWKTSLCNPLVFIFTTKLKPYSTSSNCLEIVNSQIYV